MHGDVCFRLHWPLSIKGGCGERVALGCNFGASILQLGLELADVLPENTAPAAFLKARERYFSFYPMFLVPRGIDYANQQQKIEALRLDIGETTAAAVYEAF